MRTLALGCPSERLSWRGDPLVERWIDGRYRAEPDTGTRLTELLGIHRRARALRRSAGAHP
jgi:hypothetical protein